MTQKTTSQQRSRNLPGARPRSDKARERQGAIVEEPGESADGGRDLARGEGGTVDLPGKPGDLSKDD
jgi:hypothetical protein